MICDKYVTRIGVCRETERNRFCGQIAVFGLFFRGSFAGMRVFSGFLPGDDSSPTPGKKPDILVNCYP